MQELFSSRYTTIPSKLESPCIMRESAKNVLINIPVPGYSRDEIYLELDSRGLYLRENSGTMLLSLVIPWGYDLSKLEATYQSENITLVAPSGEESVKRIPLK